MSINDPYRSFARSGIEAAVKRAGGAVKFTTENDFVLTDLKGQVLQVWPVSRFYHEVNKVINLPVVKHHSLSRCTIAMKRTGTASSAAVATVSTRISIPPLLTLQRRYVLR